MVNVKEHQQHTHHSVAPGLMMMLVVLVVLIMASSGILIKVIVGFLTFSCGGAVTFVLNPLFTGIQRVHNKRSISRDHAVLRRKRAGLQIYFRGEHAFAEMKQAVIPRFQRG